MAAKDFHWPRRTARASSAASPKDTVKKKKYRRSRNTRVSRAPVRMPRAAWGRLSSV